MDTQQTTVCPQCNQLIDITGLAPGASIACPACNHEFSITPTFDHYRLETLLGEGGMGTVYRATDLNLDREVAVKVLKPAISSDRKFIANFLREVEITASLNHPNIVSVFSFGEFNGQYYLVMEYLGSRTLDDDIEEQVQLSEADLLDIGIGVASGLNFALQHGGLIHRDIKPGNIMLTADRTPKVLDFGLALTPETAGRPGEIWGTPYYVSPERLEQQPEDFRSDMYSLGVSLYHALCGHPPFDAKTADLVAAKHLNDKPLSIKTYAPYVSEFTTYAIMKAMARQPAERYASYDEMIGQFEDAKRRLATQPARHHSPQVVVEETVETDKRMGCIVGAVVGFIALAVVLFLVWKLFIGTV
ncbi:MAG: serine/threonine protein kinase [Verrucomicrobiales bacterium]|jgi:serine/threonine protein kinase|nr:serine/threonine protein kinase [Verrucomicrobiales bacterium]